ncbi:phage tail protein [Escherichia coli]|uniref:phage tail protein n=1 Tax=Escherichia coli TaxID=562 RepID=UPI000B3DB31D|nr:phage tail protein [Escherichia coli]EEW1275683.1 phage tail protein [Escherichia coli]EEY4087837.1 phage tail protein [Escherichia coli]EFA5252303.1 phage tail protein [Escherichia coli]EFB4334224.1 phage tail protein [Escherichia coli]EFC1935966.1 phage tail protein [Escherichia coli]
MTPTRTQLNALTEYLISKLPPKVSACLDSWMENAALIYAPRDMGLYSEIAQLQFDAVLSFENYPFRVYPPALLFCLITGWLADCDTRRDELELPDPSLVIAESAEEIADVEITIKFSCPLCVREDAQGAIEWDGRRWSLSEPEIWTAEHYDLSVGVAGD